MFVLSQAPSTDTANTWTKHESQSLCKRWRSGWPKTVSADPHPGSAELFTSGNQQSRTTIVDSERVAA
eukprot:5787698-Alexandrium_andersonii.AAC.1